MTEPKVVRYKHTFFGDMVPRADGKWVKYDDPFHLASKVNALVDDIKVMERHELNEIARLAARVQELEGQLRETNEILTNRNDELFTKRQENTRLREALTARECTCIWDRPDGVTLMRVAPWCPRCQVLARTEADLKEKP